MCAARSTPPRAVPRRRPTFCLCPVCIVLVSQAYVAAPGHYVLRQPLRLVGVCDIKTLGNKKVAKVYTEDSGKTKEKEIVAGEWRKLGGVTFARSQPGFCVLSQTATGKMRVSSGLAVMKGHDKFIGFCDLNKYQRTTNEWKFPSADMTQVPLRAPGRHV